MCLISLHICTSDSWGGLEIYVCTLMVALKESGNEVVVICSKGSKIAQFLTANQIRCEYLPSKSKVSISSVKVVRHLVKEINAIAVHVHFHSDIWVASIALRRNKKTKLYLSIYMGVPKKNDFLHRWIYSRVDGIFSSSEELNNRLPTLYPVPKEKIHFLPYGRKFNYFKSDQDKRNKIRSLLNIYPNDIVIGTMIRIDPGKGIKDFVESFIYLDKGIQQKIRYIIAGEPTRKARVKSGESQFESHCELYLKQLQEFIREHLLEDRIILVGYQADVVGYLSAMDIFVFPSRDEFYSIAILEAMCMNLPVIAAAAGGNLNQINDGKSGLLYAVGNSADLASKLSQYINNPELMKQHSASARRFVGNKHDMAKTVELLLSHYQKEV
jgi:D-inositol-3-phosphate glycosyltransferase